MPCGRPNLLNGVVTAPLRSDAVNGVVGRRERRPGHVERAIGAEREVKRRHARRQRRERGRVPVAIDAEDRARSIADKERAVGAETPARTRRRDRSRTARSSRRGDTRYTVPSKRLDT